MCIIVNVNSKGTNRIEIDRKTENRLETRPENKRSVIVAAITDQALKQNSFHQEQIIEKELYYYVKEN